MMNRLDFSLHLALFYSLLYAHVKFIYFANKKEENVDVDIILEKFFLFIMKSLLVGILNFLSQTVIVCKYVLIEWRFYYEFLNRNISEMTLTFSQIFSFCFSENSSF